MAERKRCRINGVRVSDHALVRFLERAGGFEIEAIRTAIESSLRRANNKAAEIGSVDYEVRADGLRYVVRDNVVVTVTPIEGAAR